MTEPEQKQLSFVSENYVIHLIILLALLFLHELCNGNKGALL